jgi:NADH-quinone oxidoreductase subunit A
MSAAHASSLGIVAYLALFASVGLAFLFVSLLIGRFFRPSDPTPQKQETYECGEPAIGSSYVQFDLRFYVVALLFIIFDVEVAFFFPWATVFGKTTNMAALAARQEVVEEGSADEVALTQQAELIYREMGVPVKEPDLPRTPSEWVLVNQSSKQLAWVTIVDICVFFAVLLVGFAYVWKRGDLDWVRAVIRERVGEAPGGSTAAALSESEGQAVSA